MSWDDKSNNGRKNPWGSHSNDDQRKSRKGSGGGDGDRFGGGPQPDLDEMLRKAQDSFRQFMPGGFGGSKLFILGGFLILALWGASGLYYVDPSENAVITRFGKHARTQLEPGLGYHAPWPVEQMVKFDVTQDRRVQIGFAEAMNRNGARQKRDIPEESLMLTSDANIVDLDMILLWNIANAENFIFNIKDQENTIKKVTESAIREVVGQTPLQSIITEGRNVVAVKAQEIIQQTLDDYNSGVSVKEVLIQDATVHPEVLPAFDDVVAAIQDAETFQNEATIYSNEVINRADGQARQIVLQSEGYRDSKIAQAEGDAQRFNAVYEAYLKGENVTKQRMYLETMEEVLTNSSKIILDNNNGNSSVVPYLSLNELRTKTGGTGNGVRGTN